MGREEELGPLEQHGQLAVSVAGRAVAVAVEAEGCIVG